MGVSSADDGVRRPGTRGRGLQLHLLGGFELRSAGGPIPLPPAVERLVAFVALGGQGQSREHVAGSLWPDTSDERAAANLRSSLWRLRSGGLPVVATSGRRIELDGEVAVDVRWLVHLVWRTMESDPEIGDHDVAVLASTADLLPGWYDDWVVLERERLRQLRVHGLERACETLTASGRFGAAVEAGLAAIRDDPLRESAQRALVRAYVAEGNVSQAILQFRRFRSLLRSEIGIEPSHQFADLLFHS